ncbi:response regulator [Roseiarcaceae bacterium H3SJ34-1]|uniref:response regulator n=1 Tax=Terripilifer ovatus TaxID=3032367 RepID=UPI003AB91CFF|nr:response regulator [Roseiarcaceae bacterium H3SJ34-1]
MASTSRRLLVVEDQELVRSVIVRALTEAGFELFSTGASDQAIELLNDLGPTYGALITDINLDGPMSGWDLATHARGINPGLSILYLAPALPRDYVAKGLSNSALLLKPFTIEQLTEAVSVLFTDTGSR